MIDLEDYSGRTALHSAARFENVETVQYLLTKVKNKIPRANGGITPLHRAVLGNRRKVTEVLAEVSGQLEIRNSEGKTALHIATYKGFTDIVKILIRKGANIDAVRKRFIKLGCDKRPSCIILVFFW